MSESPKMTQSGVCLDCSTELHQVWHDGPCPRRRADMRRMTPAELAIREAVLAVEAVGADIRLTDAVRLLSDAKDRVADYIDGVRPESTLNVRPEPSHEAVIEAAAQHILQIVEGLSGSSIGKEILRRAWK